MGMFPSSTGRKSRPLADERQGCFDDLEWRSSKEVL